MCSLYSFFVKKMHKRRHCTPVFALFLMKSHQCIQITSNWKLSAFSIFDGIIWRRFHFIINSQWFTISLEGKLSRSCTILVTTPDVSPCLGFCSPKSCSNLCYKPSGLFFLLIKYTLGFLIIYLIIYMGTGYVFKTYSLLSMFWFLIMFGHSVWLQIISTLYGYHTT